MSTMKKLAEYHFRNGKNKKQVAKELGISLSALYKMFGGKEKVAEAEKSKMLIDYEVENALIKKACGYSYAEVKETEKANGTEVTTTYKEVAPDVSAAKAWLENKCSDTWNSEKSSSDEKLEFILDELNRKMDEEK